MKTSSIISSVKVNKHCFTHNDSEQHRLSDGGREISMGKTFNITADCKPKQHYKAFIRVAGEKMVIELKIWRGNAYNECGEKQLIDYLEHYHLKKGYMLSGID